MVNQFSRTLIGCSIILSSFFVKLSNGQSSDPCEVALARLLLPTGYVSACIPAVISYEKIERSSSLSLHIESQDKNVLELKDLQRTEGILANDRTPVFAANTSAVDSESHSYTREPFVMEDIGKLSLYQNFDLKTSCELYDDETGEHIYGTIGLDTIFIGFDLDAKLTDENSTSVKGKVAMITVTGGKNRLDANYEPAEVPTGVYGPSGRIAYVELLIVADHTLVQKVSSTVDFVRGLLLWLNAADMLFSPLQSPRIHLNIAGIFMAESPDALPYLQQSRAPENYLRLNKVMKSVEEEFYNKSEAFSFDCYDYAIVLTGQNICSKPDTECVNGRVSLKPNTVNKTMRYKDRINTATIINTMITLPTQILITKKIAQLMGVKLVGEEDAEECPGIMDDYSTISTPLTWADCSVKELTKFYNSPEAGNLWNNPQMCFAEKIENPWDGEWSRTCDIAFTKLGLLKGHAGTCIPVAIKYERINGTPSFDISFESQDESMVMELENLQETEEILANCHTPIHIANETSDFFENNPYYRDEKVMKDIGEFELYRNYDIKTSCELYTDEIGENIYGTVGLDTIFVGIGLRSRTKRQLTKVQGIAALITLRNGKNLFELNHTQSKPLTGAAELSGKEATAVLLLVTDHLSNSEISRIDLIRQILLWMNAADMLLSPLQSPRIHLKIGQILMSEENHTLAGIQNSVVTNKNLDLDTVIKNVEQQFYNESNLLPLDTYDYVVVLTWRSIYSKHNSQWVDGRVSSNPNTLNKTLRYKDRINTAAIIDVMTNLSTQIVITKKLGQLMGARLIGEEDAEECPGIMDEYSTVSTPLNWSDCSLKDFKKFFKSREAGGLLNVTDILQNADLNFVNGQSGNSSACIYNLPDTDEIQPV